MNTEIGSGEHVLTNDAFCREQKNALMLTALFSEVTLLSTLPEGIARYSFGSLSDVLTTHLSDRVRNARKTLIREMRVAPGGSSLRRVLSRDSSMGPLPFHRKTGLIACFLPSGGREEHNWGLSHREGAIRQCFTPG